jgi:predicted 3-demethylubiquinone-9 3-methyltransferase (glyoxalase superfamily)
MPEITPNLWFDTEAEEAAAFYVGVFPNSRVTTVTHYTEAGPREEGMVLTVEFELDGQRFIGINGGPEFTFDEAVSLMIECEDQAEIDHYWDALTSGGGQEGPCGWLKDRFGLSWQVVPKGWDAMFAGDDTARVTRAMRAMFTMKKIDIAAMERAADGVTA